MGTCRDLKPAFAPSNAPSNMWTAATIEPPTTASNSLSSSTRFSGFEVTKSLLLMIFLPYAMKAPYFADIIIGSLLQAAL